MTDYHRRHSNETVELEFTHQAKSSNEKMSLMHYSLSKKALVGSWISFFPRLKVGLFSHKGIYSLAGYSREYVNSY